MADQSQQNLTEGPIWRSLFKVSAPMSVGILGVLSIGLADAYFLARAGDAALAAIGFVYPVIVAISAMAIGLSAGANTAISQARGSGKPTADIVRLTIHAGAGALTLGIIVACAFWLVSPILFGLLGARDAVLRNILAYVPYWAASFPLLTTTMILEAAFRAHGDGRRAAMIMIFTAIINIALTPLFIFGGGVVPAFGMAGAGISTLIARFLALCLGLWVAQRRGVVEGVKKPSCGFVTSFKQIARVGFPAALSRGINPAGMAVVTAAVATVGDAAVAGFAAAARIQSIALIPFLALASGIAPIVGQSWGKGDTVRAQKTMQTATVFCLGYGVLAGIVLLVFADPLAKFVTAANEAAAYTGQYLRVVGFSLFGYGIVLASNAALTARSKASRALLISLVRIAMFYVPLAWIGSLLFGYTGILIAALIANVAIVWLALVITRMSDLWTFRIPILTRQADFLDRLVRRRRTHTHR